MTRFARIALLACLGLVACERGPSVNDEVASELRALRLALRDSRPQVGTEAPQAAREAIDGALRPLRDVLTQLGSSQRELATRQTALTQELARWTQLVVSAMQDQQAETGRELQQRLEQLEQSMAQQDARHREVEALMQGALDNTATHLEDFLRRLEQLQPQQPTGEPPAGREAGSGGGDPPPAPAGADVPDAAATPGGSAGAPPTNAREGSSRWPWWVLAAVAVAMGVRLLVPRRRAPLGVATEMRAAAHGDGRAGTITGARAPAETALDEPEVEELWAAAALLGEAIGKIKQSAHPEEVERLLVGPLADIDACRTPASPEPPAARDSLPADPVAAGTREDELDFDDLFVIDELDGAEPEPAAREETPRINPPAPSPRAHERARGPVIVPADDHGLPAITGSLPEPASGPVVEPIVELPRAPAVVRAAVAASCRPESITCRLAVRDAPRAEAAVRQLLDSDPRVLVQPAPEVRPAAGELCVVFALLPGLPAGERSQLEQRLRDAVA